MRHVPRIALALIAGLLAGVICAQAVATGTLFVLGVMGPADFLVLTGVLANSVLVPVASGKANGWQNLLTPSLMELISVRFLILGAPADIPGFHQVVASTTTAVGNPAVLYEKDSVPAYARVMLTAAKLPDGQDVNALLDSRFPISRVALYPDTSSEGADRIVQPFPSSAVQASVHKWTSGRMSVSLAGVDARAGHLVVSENWYPGWHATVDGHSAVVRRADHSLLGVDVPAGARQVELWFDSPAYARGKLLSVISLLVALPMIAIPFARERHTSASAG